MLSDATRKELADIISGNVVEGRNDNLAATANYLRKSFSTNTKVEKKFEQQALIKEKQKQFLIAFVNENQL